MNDQNNIEIIFADPRYGDTYSPMQWLQYIAQEFSDLADLWDEHDSNYFNEYMKEIIIHNPKMKKIERYSEVIEWAEDFILNEIHRESWYGAQQIEQNRDNIVKAFGNSVIFPNLIESLGLIESVYDMSQETIEDFWFQLYFCCCQTAEQVKEWFGGEGNAKRFKENPKLTINDYKDAIFCVDEFLEKLKKKQYSATLEEISWSITGYCKFNDKNYNETQRKIAERYEKAYRSYQYAEEKTGNTLTDRQAYDYLKEHGAENIEGFELKDFDTWQRYLRGGRRHHGTPKNTLRAGRSCRSAVKISDVDVGQITNRLKNSTDTD